MVVYNTIGYFYHEDGRLKVQFTKYMKDRYFDEMDTVITEKCLASETESDPDLLPKDYDITPQYYIKGSQTWDEVKEGIKKHAPKKNGEGSDVKGKGKQAVREVVEEGPRGDILITYPAYLDSIDSRISIAINEDSIIKTCPETGKAIIDAGDEEQIPVFRSVLPQMTEAELQTLKEEQMARRKVIREKLDRFKAREKEQAMEREKAAATKRPRFGSSFNFSGVATACRDLFNNIRVREMKA